MPRFTCSKGQSKSCRVNIIKRIKMFLQMIALSMADEDAYSFIALTEGYYRLLTDSMNKIVSQDEDEYEKDEDEKDDAGNGTVTMCL